MKPKIILAHGFAASKQQWEYQISFLEKIGYEVFTKDLLGHGDGIKPVETNQYNIEAMYLDFSAWLSSLAASDPIILIGHSLGAYLALRFSIENPTKVKKIILVSPLITKNQITSIPPLIFRFPKFGSILLRLIPGWLIFQGILKDKINSHGLNVNMLRQVAIDYKRADPRICYFGKTIVDLPRNIGNFSTSSLIIWGDKDNTLNPKLFSEFSLSTSNLIGHCVKNGGHAIHLTHKEEVNAVISEFLIT
jgi:pimeloyl-ACP methyl ester carboxylesterase